VNPDDDNRLFGYYPTLAGETETYLSAKATQEGLVMDGSPLVRFIVDDGLRHGKFEVIAEVVAAPIVEQLRDEEMERYGLALESSQGYGQREAYDARPSQPVEERQPQRQQQQKPPLPYVPEEEIDRSIDYGEYTFNSEDFEDYRAKDSDRNSAPLAYNDAAMADVNSQPLDGYAAAGAGAAVGAAARQRQRVQPATTVAFTDGAADAGASVDRRAVRARLIERANHRPYDLAGTRISVGRESGNNIKVADINASRRHAELTLNQQGLWVITDLGSMNGTLVNGVSVASQPLYPGDIVTIGKTDFEFALV
ncbi:MAG: DUF3662 domain-containing protein, partial [Eggerthellaceae bacterium]|nr:DUF3662 domain-containing protein [Eggerthellaceae bacterium]